MTMEGAATTNFGGTQYVRLTKNWNLRLGVETLSRCATVYSRGEQDEHLEGYATPVASRQIAMMDAPHEPSTKFCLVLASGQSRDWDVSEEAAKRWPAQIQFDADPQPRRWCLYVDVHPQLDEICACLSSGRVRKLTMEVYLQGLFVPENERSASGRRGQLAYVLPSSKVPKVSGYVSFVEIEEQMLGRNNGLFGRFI